MIRSLIDWWHERGAPALILAVVTAGFIGLLMMGVAFMGVVIIETFQIILGTVIAWVMP